MNAHIIAIPVSSVGLHSGFRSNSWYKHRIDIFKRYTLQSLKNQSNKDFILWLWFRPEEASNPLTQEIARALDEAKLKYVFSFNGLLYVDDKFVSYTLKTQLKNLLQMVWDMWLYKQWRSPKELWKYTWENKNKTLPVRLQSALEELKARIGTGYEWIYLTRIDSDDMFHREAVNLIQSCEPKENKALVFTTGFIYNVITKQLASWNPPTNPPFHTIIFSAKTFFDSKKHQEYYKDFKSHEDITRIFNCEVLDMYKYMVSFHGKHISTAWSSDILRKGKHILQHGSSNPFRGKEIKGYCYTTSGQNISTHWQSRLRQQKNKMIGEEYTNKTTKEQILADFGI